MTEQVDQKQRVLKLVVIGLGVAIVICIGIIVITMAMRAARLGKEQPREAAIHETRGKAQGRVLGDVDVPVPYGAQVVEVTGGPKELYVLVNAPDGRHLMLVDRATGDVLGNLRFVPGAAPDLAAPAAP
jgi:hypothetical protein